MNAAWSAVITTQGNRPEALTEAIGSLLAQRDVDLEVIVVGNGCELTGLPPGVRTVHLPSNLGAPEGRNRGVAEARGDLVFFLDDDARLPDPLTLVRIEQLFDSAPRLGVVQTRIRTPDGATLRRWVPRLRDKNPLRGSLAFSALEGSLAVRADVLRLAGGWPGPFFYAHEGIELAWRAWDAGYVVEYRPEFEAIHPRTDLARHPAHLWHNARNRVWLAKRNLPLPVAFGYVATWTLFTFIRTWRHPREMRAWLRGCWVGLRATAGPRRPISWRTVWTMTRHGRPPIA